MTSWPKLIPKFLVVYAYLQCCFLLALHFLHPGVFHLAYYATDITISIIVTLNMQPDLGKLGFHALGNGLRNTASKFAVNSSTLLAVAGWGKREEDKSLYRHFGVAVATRPPGVATRHLPTYHVEKMFMEQWQQFQVMHGSPIGHGALQRCHSLNHDITGSPKYPPEK